MYTQKFIDSLDTAKLRILFDYSRPIMQSHLKEMNHEEQWNLNLRAWQDTFQHPNGIAIEVCSNKTPILMYCGYVVKDVFCANMALQGPDVSGSTNGWKNDQDYYDCIKNFYLPNGNSKGLKACKITALNHGSFYDYMITYYNLYFNVIGVEEQTEYEGYVDITWRFTA